MKSLPISLKNLELCLSSNNFGENKDNMRYLGEGMKQLPKNL